MSSVLIVRIEFAKRAHRLFFGDTINYLEIIYSLVSITIHGIGYGKRALEMRPGCSIGYACYLLRNKKHYTCLI
jgi:hypothetical protein